MEPPCFEIIFCDPFRLFSYEGFNRRMQTYDFLMLFVLLGTTLFGFVKGLAWQVAYLASLVVSYFVALRFSTQLAPMFGESEPFNRYVAMLAIYVGTSFAIWMIFRVVAGTIDRVKLKEFDRQMGALIGFARGVLWCIAITFFAATLLESYRPAIPWVAVRPLHRCATRQNPRAVAVRDS